MKKMTIKNIVKFSASVAILAGVSQFSFAHTRLQVSSIDENSASHGSDYNNEVIAHGCRNEDGSGVDTVGTVVVFPDGEDSIVMENGEMSDKTTADFVPGWGSPVAKIQDKDVFNYEEEIKSPLGNVVGYWAGALGTEGLKSGLTGVIPFRTSGVVINPESCATSVKFIVAIADICALTTIEGFNDADVMLWTPAVGSNFDGTDDLNGYDSPASLTVNRTIAPLPESCGDGVEVTIKPSAAQLNRDMPVSIDGVQVWPTP